MPLVTSASSASRSWNINKKDEQCSSFYYNVDVAFLSCKGVSEDGRFTDTSEEETAIRRAFLQNARTSALLMTQNKFGNTYLHTLCHARDVDYLFSDGEIPSSIQTRQ